MTFSDRVLSITREDIIPKVFDNFLSDNIITYRFMGNGEKFTSTSAKVPVKVAKNTQGITFSGMATLNTGTVETRKKMEFTPSAYSIPVAIPSLERAVNQTDGQVVELMRVEFESTAQDAIDDMADQLYGNGGGDDFNGFGNLIDDGTVSSTIGGLSRTTYPTLASTRTNFSSVVTLAKLQTMFRSVSGGSIGKQRPTIIISDEASVDYYEQLLTPTMRNSYEAAGGFKVTRSSKGAIKANEFRGEGGMVAFSYKGTPWVGDEKAPSAKTWFVNENYVSFLGLPIKGLKSVSFGSLIDGAVEDMPSSNNGLQYRDFMDSFNQLGEVAHIVCSGQLIQKAPRRSGVAVNTDGV